jgi:hypothetical protein
MRLSLRRSTYANVTATAALIIALGGTSYAAATLAKNSVGTKQVKNHSLLAKDVKAGQLTKGALDGRLPSGVTLRGGWGQSASNPADTGEIQTSAVSFALPLATNVTANIVQEGAPSTTNCPGTVAAPKARKGFFCIYVGAGTNHVDVDSYAELNGGDDFRFGGVVYWRPQSAGSFTYASGTYAVRAP